MLVALEPVVRMQSASLKQIEIEQETATPGCCTLVLSPTLDEAQAQEYASWFKVLADPTRIRILNLLARNREPLCVCDIVENFDIGQPSISHHLKILRQARFVTVTRQGAFMYYSVNRDCLSAFPHAARLIMNV